MLKLCNPFIKNLKIAFSRYFKYPHNPKNMKINVFQLIFNKINFATRWILENVTYMGLHFNLLIKI